MDKNKRWPVAIAIIYGSFVMLLIGFVIYSTVSRVDLVAHDYYRQELAYQNQIDRIQRSRQLQHPLKWHYDREKALIILEFPDTLNAGDISGSVLFFRPSDAQQDNIKQLQAGPENRRSISVRHFSRGFWRIKINWQYAGQEYYDEFSVYIQ